jgi:hypothetical protein
VSASQAIALPACGVCPHQWTVSEGLCVFPALLWGMGVANTRGMLLHIAQHGISNGLLHAHMCPNADLVGQTVSCMSLLSGATLAA